MKIAIHSPFIESAETAGGLSMIAAGGKLGHNIAMFNHIKDIEEFNPDFVLVCHHYLPKLTKFITYGYLFDSLGRYDNPTSQKAIVSWDGYITPSSRIGEYIKSLCYAMNKIAPKNIFYNTSHISYDEEGQLLKTEVNILKDPKLIYFGNNWDNRHLKLLSLLSNEKYFELYGPSSSWTKLPKITAYKGPVEYTQYAVINTYRQGGVGLALQSNYFAYDDVISNRIFEINSAGAVAITGHMPFVKEYYGDSVLYVDQFKKPQEVYEQIITHMNWIKKNPAEALNMALKAQEIFNERLSIEKLLGNVIQYHNDALIESGYVCNIAKAPKIVVIIRTGGRSLAFLERALNSVIAQSYTNKCLIVVIHQRTDGLFELLDKYKPKITIDIIEHYGAIRSTTLWAALNHVKHNNYDYFSILDDDDEFFPNHLASLYNTLQSKKNLGYDAKFAASFVLYQLLESRIEYLAIKENRDVWSSPINASTKKVIEGMPMNSFLCASDILDDKMLIDPIMHTAEDSYLLFSLFQKVIPYFSFRVSAIVYNHGIEQSNFDTHPCRQYDMLKLQTNFYGQRFANGEMISADVMTNSIEYPEYVHEGHEPFTFMLTDRSTKVKIKKFLKPYKPLIVFFISKPLRFLGRIFHRLYYLQ